MILRDCEPGTLVKCPSGRRARVVKNQGRGTEENKVLLRYVGTTDDVVLIDPQLLVKEPD